MQSIQYLKRHPYVLLTLCALVLFLAANNFLAITDSAESNYALTAKEMVLSGNWVSPQIYGPFSTIGSWPHPLPSSASTNLPPAFPPPLWAR